MTSISLPLGVPLGGCARGGFENLSNFGFLITFFCVPVYRLGVGSRSLELAVSEPHLLSLPDLFSSSIMASPSFGDFFLTNRYG